MSLAACLAGLAAAPLWTAQATYTNRIARYYAYHTQKNVEHIISLFFGIFFAVLNTCTIWGNMVSYFVLNQSNIPQKVNCGVYFDPLSKHNDEIPAVVSDFTVNSLENYFPSYFDSLKRYLLCGVFTAIGSLSIILIFFVDQIRLGKPRKSLV